MANNFKIVIAALDKTEAAFAKIRHNLGAVGRSLDKLKKRFPTLSGIAGKALGGISSLFKTIAKSAGIAAVATAGIFTLLVKQSLSATDSLAKTARKIGVTTEALASMRYAAKLTGVETATMDMALQRFTRRAAEAAKGTGEAKGALKELKLDATELIKLPLEQQMQELAGAFAEVETDADKVRLAMKLFDSEGVALVNTLGIGKQGLIEMAAEANKLGITLSKDATDGVEDANDAFTRLGQLFKGVRDQTVAALAPALETLATTLKEKVLTAIEATDGGVEQFAKNLAVKILNGVMAAIKGLQALVNAVIGTFNDIRTAAASFTGFFKSDDEKNALQLQKAMQKINETMSERQRLIDSTTGRMQRSHQLAQESDQAQLDSMQALLDKRVEVGDTPLIPEVNMADQIQETFDNIIAGITGVGEAKNNLGETPPVVPKEKDTRNALQKNFDALKKAGKNEIDFENKRSDEKAKIVASGLQKNLAIAGQKSKKMFALSKAAGIAEALISTYQGAAKSMGAYPFPINVAMAASSVAAGMAQVSAIRSQSFEGGGFTGHGSRSGGVDGKGGFPAILHPNETVIDHTKSGGAQTVQKEGDIIVNQTINVTTGVQQTVRAEIENLMPVISEQAKTAVANAKMRGGAYARMMS